MPRCRCPPQQRLPQELWRADGMLWWQRFWQHAELPITIQGGLKANYQFIAILIKFTHGVRSQYCSVMQDLIRLSSVMQDVRHIFIEHWKASHAGLQADTARNLVSCLVWAGQQPRMGRRQRPGSCTRPQAPGRSCSACAPCRATSCPCATTCIQ